MEIYIFDINLNLLGVLENINSLQWNRKYNDCGNFEIETTTNNIPLLKNGNIVYKSDDLEGGCIERIHMKLDENGNEKINVRGRFITKYLGKRIIWGQTIINDKSEIAMRKIVNDNCVNPVDIKRKIPLLELGALKNFNLPIEFQNSYGNVLNKLKDISIVSNLGFRNILDVTRKRILFDVFQGIDRSINQSKIAPCIFSTELENVLSQEYVNDIENYKNVALIGGAGEGIDRKMTTINNELNGMERDELFVDARDLSDKDGEGKVIPNYLNILAQRGNEKLEQYSKISTLESEINTLSNNRYKIDYNLGDIVTIYSKKWGIKLDTRITEVKEIYEKGTIQIIPTFGNNIPTLSDKIKRAVS